MEQGLRELNKRYSTPKTDRNQKIYQLNIEGKSFYDIAKIYEITPQRVGQIVTRQRRLIKKMQEVTKNQ